MTLRKHKKRFRILLIVVGFICLVIGGLIAASNLFRHEHEQARFFRVALVYAYVGAGLVALDFLIFKLPEIVRTRRSATFKRRHGRPQPFRRGSLPPPDEDGSILVVTLILLGLIAGLSLHVITRARSAQAEAHAVASVRLLQLAALDSARNALQYLADDPDLAADHSSEDWAKPVEVTDPAGITRMTRVEDLQAAFDLNNLGVSSTGAQARPYDVLARIMTACGIFTPGSILDALRDWVDTDNTGPYEAAFYERADPPSAPAGRLLYSRAELLQVEGWSARLFDRKPASTRGGLFQGNLADGVTIIPVPRQRIIPLNINTASPEALFGLFGVGNEALVERILARRLEGPITRLDFMARLAGADALAGLTPYLEMRSSWFRIQSTAFKDGQSARLDLIARRQEDGRMDVVKATY